MKKLSSTDYVICNKDKTEMFSFVDTNQVVIYGNKYEAILDLDEDELLVSCTDLPKHLQDILIKQINN
jgi:hypothetical protein